MITVYDKLAIKVNAIDTKKPSTSRLVTKTLYNSNKQGLERKIEDVNKKAGQKTVYSTKITETENKIPGLVTTAMLTTKASEIENKIPGTTGFYYYF